MAQAHIPQPNAAGPAEDFSSTDAALHGPTVSDIGVPPGPPAEVSPHTGAVNTFDITIHRQFIPTDTVQWTTAQTKGTLIWKIPLHPRKMNPILAYLSGLYNAWGGGFDFNFKIAGTGFHAGALAIVRIPPNRSPEEFPTPSSWGPFEYRVMDPKMLEVASLDVGDQRPINYHYADFDPTIPNTFGGWLAMYVLIPLNTSATGSQSISVQVFNRPGPTFQYSQLITPYLNSPRYQVPEQINPLFNFDNFQILANAPMRAHRFVISPLTLKETDKVMNTFGVNSVANSKFLPHYTALALNPYIFPPIAAVITDTAIATFIYEIPVQIQPADDSNLIVYQANGTKCEHYGATEWTTTAAGVDGIDIQLKAATTSSTLTTSESCLFYPRKVVPLKILDKVLSAATNTESIVLFASVSPVGDIRCIQTANISAAFYRGDFNTIYTPGQCLLMVIRDKTENLNLGYAKIYPNGLITARASTDEVVFAIENIQLIFDSFVLTTDPIPVNATYALNRMVLSQKYAMSQQQPSSQSLTNRLIYESHGPICVPDRGSSLRRIEYD